MSKKLFLSVFSLVTVIASSAHAQDYVITIKDHKFSPADIAIPADQKVKLIVKNNDSTAEEFESSDLNREKVVAANSEITILVGPLKAGSYNFVGDFHQDTAKGVITVK